MDEIIEALGYFSKYMSETEMKYPFHCEHDILYINCNVGESDMAVNDFDRLNELGFHWDYEASCWASYRYGSC